MHLQLSSGPCTSLHLVASKHANAHVNLHAGPALCSLHAIQLACLRPSDLMHWWALCAMGRRTSYRPMMTILASRERFCLHPDIAVAPNKTEACEGATMVGHMDCTYLENAEASWYPQVPSHMQLTIILIVTRHTRVITNNNNNSNNGDDNNNSNSIMTGLPAYARYLLGMFQSSSERQHALTL